MKRFCLAVLLAVGFAVNAAPAFAQPPPGLAPADRYFGRLKMLHDWATQFPRDPWIPRFAHALADLYRKVDTEEPGSARTTPSTG